MKRIGTEFLFTAGFVAVLFFPSGPADAATAPALGNAESFVVLGATAVGNTGTSVITGDLGIAPGLAAAVTGFPPGLVTGGSIFAGPAVPDPTAAAAQLDASAAFTALDQPCTTTFVAPTDLGGMTLAASGEADAGDVRAAVELGLRRG